MRELPRELPLFPLEKCILIPGCNIPLRLFEPRYLQMYEALPQGGKYIGLIQPKTAKDPTHLNLFDVGTVGEVVEARHLPNRRYSIVLRGIRRFYLEQEIMDQKVLYRKAQVSYDRFLTDPRKNDVPLDRDQFFVLLDRFVKHKKINIKMSNIKAIRSFQIINILSQVLPFSMLEKQSLLEIPSHHDRMEQLITLLKMEVETSNHLLGQIALSGTN